MAGLLLFVKHSLQIKDNVNQYISVLSSKWQPKSSTLFWVSITAYICANLSNKYIK